MALRATALLLAALPIFVAAVEHQPDGVDMLLGRVLREVGSHIDDPEAAARLVLSQARAAVYEHTERLATPASDTRRTFTAVPVPVASPPGSRQLTERPWLYKQGFSLVQLDGVDIADNLSGAGRQFISAENAAGHVTRWENIRPLNEHEGRKCIFVVDLESAPRPPFTSPPLSPTESIVIVGYITPKGEFFLPMPTELHPFGDIACGVRVRRVAIVTLAGNLSCLLHDFDDVYDSGYGIGYDSEDYGQRACEGLDATTSVRKGADPNDCNCGGGYDDEEREDSWHLKMRTRGPASREEVEEWCTLGKMNQRPFPEKEYQMKGRRGVKGIAVSEVDVYTPYDWEDDDWYEDDYEARMKENDPEDLEYGDEL